MRSRPILASLKQINNQNQLDIGNGHIHWLKDGLSSVEMLMLMCQRSEGVACLFWVIWHLHLRYGFQCYHCWTVLVCWSHGLKCQQCEGMAWIFWCWRYLDFYRKRLNPTSQSWTQIRTDSREGNTGRWETLWACQAQVCILIRHGGCMWQSTRSEIECCWHSPNLGIAIPRNNWVIDLLFNTRLIHKRFRLWFFIVA